MPTFKPQYKDKNGIIQDLNIDYNSLANKPTTKNEIESLKSNINTLDKRVTSIESRLSDRIFKVDSDLAYIKTVPAGALPYASIDMIGGNVVKEPLTNRAKVLGEAIKWNQLCDGVNRTFSVLGVSYTISNNKVIRTGTAEGSGGRTSFSEVYRYIDLKEGHIYLNPYGLFINMPDYVTQLQIFTSNTTGSVSFGNNVSQGVEYNDTFYLTIIDLTSIYGTGNEPTDMNDARVQQLIAYAQSHPEYDSGSVRSVELNEVEYYGENLWTWYTSKRMQISELLLNREITFSTPNIVTFSVKVKPIEYPNNKLFFNITYADSTTEIVCFYNTMSSEVTSLHLKTSKKVTKISSDYNFGGLCDIDYFVVSINSQSISFSQPISLNGLETKDELYSQVEGNELVSYKLQRYGKVDLGTLDYSLKISNNRYIFVHDLSDLKKSERADIPINAICQLYNTVKTDDTWVDKDMAYEYSSNSSSIAFVNNSYNDVATFKTAMQGVELVYELATPTITEISRVPLTCDFEQVENVLIDSVLGSTELEKGVLKVQCTEKVVSVGVNIWDEEWEVGAIGSNGSPFQSNSIRSKNFCKAVPNATYYSNVGYVRMCYYDEDFNFLYRDTNPGYTHEAPSNCCYFKITLADAYGATYKNDICINVSNDAINGTYIPYFSYNYPIPSSIQSLEGYGWGVNDSLYNYIDFERKKFVKKVGRVDLGTLNWESWWSESGNPYRAYVNLPKKKKGLTNFICSKYNVVNKTDDKLGDKEMCGNTANTFIYVKDTGYSTFEEWKTINKDVEIYYELATPVETDLSNILTDDNFIEVEANGTLTFENTNKKAVPSKIAYLVEVE